MMNTVTCRICGKTVSLPENVQYWPGYCEECRAEHRPNQMITRTCRKCGTAFTFSSSEQHWPKFCRECRKKQKKRWRFPLLFSLLVLFAMILPCTVFADVTCTPLYRNDADLPEGPVTFRDIFKTNAFGKKLILFQ